MGSEMLSEGMGNPVGLKELGRIGIRVGLEEPGSDTVRDGTGTFVGIMDGGSGGSDDAGMIGCPLWTGGPADTVIPTDVLKDSPPDVTGGRSTCACAPQRRAAATTKASDNIAPPLYCLEVEPGTEMNKWFLVGKGQREWAF